MYKFTVSIDTQLIINWPLGRKRSDLRAPWSKRLWQNQLAFCSGGKKEAEQWSGSGCSFLFIDGIISALILLLT